MRIAIQPCSDTIAQQHFKDTIGNLVPKEKILPYLSEKEKIDFNDICKNEIAVWGVTGGKKGQNKNKWNKLKSGDLVLLYANKRIFNKAKVKLCVHNKELALSLWSSKENGETWEYIYFLDEIEDIEFPIDKFNEIVGYKDNFIIQGFNVLENEKAYSLAEYLNEEEITPDQFLKTTDTKVLEKQLVDLENTELSRTIKIRTESQIFRNFLFGKSIHSKCDICSRELPNRLLIAAHIKPRSSCSDSEKRDFNVIFRACKLGCDDLFEKSYIIVDENGFIRSTQNVENTTEELKRYLSQIVNRKCSIFSEKNKHYFEWRRLHQKRYVR